MRDRKKDNWITIEQAIKLNNPHLQRAGLENDLLCVLAVLRVLKTWGGAIVKKDYREIKKRFEQVLKEMDLTYLKYDDVFLNVILSIDYTDFSWQEFYAKHCELVCGADYVLHENMQDEIEKVITAKSKRCLVVNAESFIMQLDALVQNNPGVEFYFSCSEKFYRKVFQIMFHDSSNVKIFDESILDKEEIIKDIEGFDVALITTGSSKLSKWGIENLGIEYAKKKSRYLYQVFLDLVHHYMSNGCRIAAVVPAQFQFVGDETKLLRENIAANYRIEELVLLPDDATYGSGLQMLLLKYEGKGKSNGHVGLKKYKSDGRNWKIEDKRTIAQDILRNMEVWSDVWQKNFSGWYSSTGRGNIRLGDVAEIFRGKAIKAGGSKHILVNIGNIGEYEINIDEPTFCEGDDRKLAQYALRDGDVVIPARGTTLRAAVYKARGDEGWYNGRMYIASSNVIVIRPDRTKINSRYLALLLGSAEGNELIRGVQQGNKVMNLSYESLKELRLELPPLKEQNSIAGYFESAFEEYMMRINTAERKWLVARHEVQHKLWRK